MNKKKTKAPKVKKMTGINVIFAELEAMSRDEQKDALVEILMWADEQDIRT